MKIHHILPVLLLAQLASGCTAPGTSTPTPTPGAAQGSELWKFRDLSDPDAPNLIEKNGESFKLKQGWKVTSI
ncbi:MAG: hypothetical protein M3328_16220, partial [Chloroflexota bacterium]|nr:hypothetical protein [Chloroflexota bacterium]